MDTNGNMSSAAKWRELASRHKDNTVDLTLPSGMVVKARRPNVGTWIRSGRVPQTVTTAMLKAAKSGKNPTEVMKSLDENQFMDVMTFMRDLVLETVVEPRIVLEPNSPEEIGAGEIPDEDFDFIAMWAMEGTVQMKGGDVTVEELASFRPDASLPGTGENGGEVRPAA